MSNNNNRMIVFASILGAILATSILALNPSTITNAGAQMYESQYGYDNGHYQDDYQYGYDNSYYNQDYNEYSYDDNSRVQLEFDGKYGDNDDYYKHPSKDHKFACKTGQFKGFFVKSPEVCDLQIPNSISVYRVEGDVDSSSGDGVAESFAFCDAGDTVLSGSYDLTNPDHVFTNVHDFVNDEDTAWEAAAIGAPAEKVVSIKAFANCFDNPPLRP